MKKEKLEDMFMAVSSALLIGAIGIMQTDEFNTQLDKYYSFSKNHSYSYNSQIDSSSKLNKYFDIPNLYKQTQSLL